MSAARVCFEQWAAREAEDEQEQEAMTIFVAEINGQGIAAFSQNTPDDALAWADDKDFRSDLMTLEGQDGRPLWDGLAEIYVREAYPEEADRWKASYVRALHDGDAEDESDWVIYLVPVTEPPDDDDYDE
jgi:hypothetical protein